MVYTYFLHKCPCGHVYDVTYFTAEVGPRLGTGAIICRSCGRTVSDGSMEWAQMTKLARLRLFVPGLTWPFLALLALLPFITSVKEGKLDGPTFAVAGAFLFGVLPLMASPFWAFRAWQVRESKLRSAGDAAAVARGPRAFSGQDIQDALIVLTLVAAGLAFGGYHARKKWLLSEMRHARVAAKFSQVRVGQTEKEIADLVGPPTHFCTVDVKNPDGSQLPVAIYRIYRGKESDLRARFELPAPGVVGDDDGSPLKASAVDEARPGSDGFCEGYEESVW